MAKVMKYFEFPSAAQFKAEWTKLSEESREQLKAGVADDTLTY